MAQGVVSWVVATVFLLLLLMNEYAERIRQGDSLLQGFCRERLSRYLRGCTNAMFTEKGKRT